ncbi:MAG TPA: peptidylprolyl isomerase [Thermoanaerobaculia bacterium]|nr:peptidylprolyl isomerase [Thermoanaerobaculia bacterium]
MTSNRPLFRPLGAAAATLAALVALAPAPPLSASEVVNRILIHVNSRIITQSQFDARMDQSIRENGAPPTPAQREALKKSVMEELVNEALLEDRARELDLITTDQEIEDQIKRLKEQNNVRTDEEFTKSLAASGLTIDRLRDQLRRSQTLQRVVGREVQAKVDLSDDALRLIYEREKEAWRVPEKAHLAEILISKGDDPAAAARRAKEASDLLKGGAKFEAVVKEFSDGGTKAKGGDLGVVAKGELAADIDKAVFSLPVGAVSDPIQTKFGWHLVKVIEKVPVSYKAFADVKADLLKREQDTQFQKKLAEYLEKLKRDAVIRVNPEAQAYFTPPPPPPGFSQTAGPTVFDQAAGVVGVGTGPATKASRDPVVEITPTVGWRWGGTTSESVTSYFEKIGVPNAMSWGLTFEYVITPWGSLEALWSHQNTTLTAQFTAGTVGYDDKLSHLNVDTFQIGGMWMSGDASNKARLYFDLLLGVTVLTPSPGFETITRFSGSVGGGIKYYFADHFGLRAGARWMPVYVNSSASGGGYCDPIYGCYTWYGTNYLNQGDAHLGLIARF